MSLKIPSKMGGALPSLLEPLVQAKGSQTPAPTAPPAAKAAIPGCTDSFEPQHTTGAKWAAKFAEAVATMAPELQKLAPTELKALKDVANSVNEQRNAVANEQKNEWAKSTPVLQQTEDANCGAAAAAMLVRAKDGKADKSDSDLIDELETQFASKEGTTPEQLSKMLAHEGIEVKHGTADLEKDTLDEALHTGKKALAMVDSNQISTHASAQEPGKAHWVVIDGMDQKGRYMVKDPGTGSSYFVKPEELNKAIATGREKHQSGGMMIVENTKSQAPEPVLAEESAKKSEALGKGQGGGSNTSRFGRESS
ncbi:cysteine peptidase family C39 domain-containing protein [Archangium sp.]|uniref:cysteine peptidase family C39 domain-containing protein n=1 Tax=Archangium sp. TaxID=1872627 RepID=UPI003899E10D